MSGDIGVVVPARDAARYLGEALESVLAQTVQPAQVVVVDDGSTDATAAIAESFGTRVSVIRQPPRGPAAARNRGLGELRTNYVCLLDADDLWPADSLAVRLAALSADAQLDLCFGHMEQFASPDLAPAERRRLHVPAGPQPAWASSAMMARRSVFARIGTLPEQRRAADFLDWLLRARAAGVRALMLDHVVLRRRLHTANLTRREPEANADYLAVVRAELARRRAAGR
ncbi:MAG TPA: glycosyltransferase family A protein [Candidatus Limnocylindrales bacterium]